MNKARNGYNYDYSLLELSFDKNDSTIHRITFFICKDYEKTNENYQIPSNYESGDVLIESVGEIELSILGSVIYSNVVKVVVSNEVPDTCILSGNVVWKLNSCGDLISLCVIDSTGITSEHCYKELDYFSNNKFKISGYILVAFFFQLSTILLALSLEPAKVLTSKIVSLFSTILHFTV